MTSDIKIILLVIALAFIWMVITNVFA